MTNEQAIDIMSKVTFYWELGEQTLTQNQINEALDMAIEALEQEPCEDCISREEALSHKHIVYDDDGIGYSVVRADVIEKLLSVIPQPKTGRWINRHYIYQDKTIDMKVCNICNYEFSYDAETGISEANFCHNCGARMEEENDN